MFDYLNTLEADISDRKKSETFGSRKDSLILNKDDEFFIAICEREYDGIHHSYIVAGIKK